MFIKSKIGTDISQLRKLDMTHLKLNRLSHDDRMDAGTTALSLSCPLIMRDIKDIFTGSRLREDRLQSLYCIRSDLFACDFLDIEDGYSSFIAEIDRALGLLETSPVGSADPEVLQRIDHIELSMLG